MSKPSKNQELRPFRVVIVGHVDHGKSTLVGRLFNDTGSLPDGKKEQIEEQCERRGVPFEWAFLMDALQAERDQNITIDTSQIWFKTGNRPYVIIDAPGHREFLKNMITGAASAEAALLLIAADEGVREQSRRHGYLLSLLGIKQVTVVVNKMDLVDFDQGAFDAIEAEYRSFLAEVGLQPRAFIPISAREGDNIAARSQHMAWYQGPTVVEGLDGFDAIEPIVDQPLRFPVQDIYRFDERRIIAGRIESGQINVGDELVFLPGKKSGRVKTIERWAAHPTDIAFAGESVGITLEEQIFVERGHMAVHRSHQPVVTDRFRANVFWMGQRALEEGRRYTLKLATQEVACRVERIERVIDASSLSTKDGNVVPKDGVAELILETSMPVALDVHAEIETLGRFVLVDAYDVSGGGIVTTTLPSRADAGEPERPVSQSERRARLGHVPAVVVLHGRSEGARAEFAYGLERALFDRGIQALVLERVEGCCSEVVRALVRAGLVVILDAAPEANYAPGLASTYEIALAEEALEDVFFSAPSELPIRNQLDALIEVLLPKLRSMWAADAANI